LAIIFSFSWIHGDELLLLDKKGPVAAVSYGAARRQSSCSASKAGAHAGNKAASTSVVGFKA